MYDEPCICNPTPPITTTRAFVCESARRTSRKLLPTGVLVDLPRYVYESASANNVFKQLVGRKRHVAKNER